MSRNRTIAKRLEEVLLNGHWIANTNYKEQLLSVNWNEATQRVNDLNTISALTFHVNYYLDGLLKAFETGKLEISDKYSFDAPPIHSEADWNKLVDELLLNSGRFVEKVKNMDDAIFDQPFIDEKYGSYQKNIEAVIEHSYYHLGQITLIKKLIRQKA